MERLNDNEVREVAKMQRLITKYENVITALFLKAKFNIHIDILSIEKSDLDGDIAFLFKWIKEKREGV